MEESNYICEARLNKKCTKTEYDCIHAMPHPVVHGCLRTHCGILNISVSCTAVTPGTEFALVLLYGRKR